MAEERTMCRGVRGATAVDRNDREEILAVTRQMLALMIVILVIGIVVDTVFGRADLAIRRRWGLIDPSH